MGADAAAAAGGSAVTDGRLTSVGGLPTSGGRFPNATAGGVAVSSLGGVFEDESSSRSASSWLVSEDCLRTSSSDHGKVTDNNFPAPFPSAAKVAGTRDFRRCSGGSRDAAREYRLRTSVIPEPGGCPARTSAPLAIGCADGGSEPAPGFSGGLDGAALTRPFLESTSRGLTGSLAPGRAPPVCPASGGEAGGGAEPRIAGAATALGRVVGLARPAPPRPPPPRGVATISSSSS